MTWKDVSGFIASAAPTVGSILLGPAGGKVGELVSAVLGVPNDPDKVMEALKNNPEAMVKVKEIEANRQIELARIALGEETKQISAVNETMRVETTATGQAWYQKAWRPACGFAVALGSFLSIAVACILLFSAVLSRDFAQIASVLSILPQFAGSIAAILAIPGAAVGIAAYHRGKTQRIEAGEGQK